MVSIPSFRESSTRNSELESTSAFAYDYCQRGTRTRWSGFVGAFGEKLRRQREHRGLTLDAISTTTKISTRMLSAIEDERFDQLPGGVFNKGFVRAYARQVGLNEDETVTDYLAALAESQIRAQAVLPNFRNVPAPASAKPENTAPHTIPAVPVPASTRDQNAAAERRALSDRRSASRRVDDRPLDRQNLGGHELGRRDDHVAINHVEVDRVAKEDYVAKNEGVIVENHREEEPFEDVPSTPPSFLHLSDPSGPGTYAETFVSEAAPANSPRPIHWERLAIPLVLITLVLALWTFYRGNHPTRESQPVAASEPSVPEISPASSQVPPVVPTPASSTPTQANAASTNLTPRPSPAKPFSDVTKISLPPPRVTKPTPPPKFTLTIRASQTSWVAITADGQSVATETLFAPANTSIRAQREITVKTRNAAGVNFLLNGKELSAEGGPGEVRTYTFDANGLRDSPAASNSNQTN